MHAVFLAFVAYVPLFYLVTAKPNYLHQEALPFHRHQQQQPSTLYFKMLL